MCVDGVLASLRITQVDPGDEPLPKMVLSQSSMTARVATIRYKSHSMPF
jgi:hypothetical protein